MTLNSESASTLIDALFLKRLLSKENWIFAGLLWGKFMVRDLFECRVESTEGGRKQSAWIVHRFIQLNLLQTTKAVNPFKLRKFAKYLQKKLPGKYPQRKCSSQIEIYLPFLNEIIFVLNIFGINLKCGIIFGRLLLCIECCVSLA